MGWGQKRWSTAHKESAPVASACRQSSARFRAVHSVVPEVLLRSSGSSPCKLAGRTNPSVGIRAPLPTGVTPSCYADTGSVPTHSKSESSRHRPPLRAHRERPGCSVRRRSPDPHRRSRRWTIPARSAQPAAELPWRSDSRRAPNGDGWRSARCPPPGDPAPPPVRRPDWRPTRPRGRTRRHEECRRAGAPSTSREGAARRVPPSPPPSRRRGARGCPASRSGTVGARRTRVVGVWTRRDSTGAGY